MPASRDQIPIVTGPDRRAFQRSLLRWYDRHRRDLPWRRTRDPYRIWVSEIMLQQTRVAAVLEHYRHFLKRFPNVLTLAGASEDEVLTAWSGLGYYRRARMLRQCAREIVKEHKGRFPSTAEQLSMLPGIGRYTAAAIGSIAFDEPIAVVDGNVERVLARLSGRELAMRELWTQAQLLLNRSRPGDHNQALMELGATICAPRGPDCNACPIRKWCAHSSEVVRTAAMERRGARPEHLTRGMPRLPSERTRQTKKEIWCALVQRDGHIRLVRRATDASLMAGMWELPQWAAEPRIGGQLPSEARSGAASSYQAPWRSFRHSITTTDYTVHVLREFRRVSAGTKWVAFPRLGELPLTGLTRKILKAAGII